jgi:hypothetical protein
VIRNGYDSRVNLIHDIAEKGCIDYVGALPCDNTYWTTSDSYPTCLTLGDFGYSREQAAILQRAESFGCFHQPASGQRYEAYCGYPIVVGNPGNKHAIFKPGSLELDTSATCMSPRCLASCPPYGMLDGAPYKIQADVWSGSGAWGYARFNINDALDIVAPQCANALLRGRESLAKEILANLIARFTSTSFVGKGSSWQLGQVMFLMRVLGQDDTNEFRQMEKLLWSIQDQGNGWLPNGYSGYGQPKPGHNPENQDAGLLPYSASCVDRMRSLVGSFANAPLTPP